MITEIDYNETSEQPQEEKSYEDIGYWIPEDWGTERIKICIGALLEKGAFGRRAGGDRTAASCTPLEMRESIISPAMISPSMTAFWIRPVYWE